MKKDLTEIVLILDVSGSMKAFENDSIGGLNQFLEDQRKLPGQANVTLTLFNEDVNQKLKSVDLKNVPNFSSENYRCAGSTALYDGIGTTIDTVGNRLDLTKEEDRPEHVIVAILTDGEENASKEYKQSDIFKLIKEQRDTYKWEFVFLAANQDAFKVGTSIGIVNNMSYTVDNTDKVYNSMSLYSKSVRSVGDTSQVDVDEMMKSLNTKK